MWRIMGQREGSQVQNSRKKTRWPLLMSNVRLSWNPSTAGSILKMVRSHFLLSDSNQYYRLPPDLDGKKNPREDTLNLRGHQLRVWCSNLKTNNRNMNGKTSIPRWSRQIPPIHGIIVRKRELVMARTISVPHLMTDTSWITIAKVSWKRLSMMTGSK